METEAWTTDYTDTTDGDSFGFRLSPGVAIRWCMIHEDISESIIGAAMRVLNTLKPGLDEKLYENALRLELREGSHNVEQQKPFRVFYKGELIGTLIPDLIVDGLVIVDPKVVSAFNETHTAQMSGYLAITNLKLALLLNFKSAKLDWKRIVR